MKYVFLLILVLGVLIMSCGGESGQTESDTLYVVATTGMIADLVKEIGGQHVEVDGLMGPGVDPHLFKASQGDIRKLADADIIFYNGLNLEGKMTGIFQKMAREKPVVAVTRNIDPAMLVKPEEYEGEFDPHVWFDVSLWQKTIEVVKEVLMDADSTHYASFKENALRYASALDTLDDWVTGQIESIPEAQRVLVTAHDAFTYFGRAYNIEVKGLQGMSTIAEYGVNDINRLVDFIVKRKIRAIFVESSVPQRSIDAVREGCLAKNFDVKIGGTLYSDAMGAPGSGADTYIGMVRMNVTTIVKALK